MQFSGASSIGRLSKAQPMSLDLKSPRSLAPCELVTFKIEGLGAEFVMPLGKGQSLEHQFQAYLKGIQSEHLSEDCGKIAESLLNKKVWQVSPEPSKPRVGVLMNDLFQLGESKRATLFGPIQRTGCQPVVILPMVFHRPELSREASFKLMNQVSQSLDGVLAPGGEDLDPKTYGASSRGSLRTHLDRDRSDMAFALGAIAGRKAYISAICRSHQMINALLGGDMIQDVQAEGYSSIDRHQTHHGIDGRQPFVLKEGGRKVFEHLVTLKPGSQIQQSASVGEWLTNSRHHQAVKTPGIGLEVSAHTTDPGTGKRLVEGTQGTAIITCQFHPEDMSYDEKAMRHVDIVGRRAQMIHHVKQLKSHKMPIHRSTLESWMQAKTQGGARLFQPSDYQWLNQGGFDFLQAMPV